MPPPVWFVMPPEMERPDTAAVTPASTSNTWTALSPLILNRSAPGPSITSAPTFSDNSRVLARVIVCGELKTVGSNSISLPPESVSALARLIT